jgi:hypothetical protein
MVSRIWLFGLILGVPLIGLAVAQGIQAHFNSELRSVVRKQYPNADPEGISQMTLIIISYVRAATPGFATSAVQTQT